MSRKLKFDAEKKVLTIPEVKGVVYTIDGKPVTGDVKINKTTTVEAAPAQGFRFKEGQKTSWDFDPEK